ncbi:hypothetical protein [Microbacterium sp.]|uniref:hypothetical protein n=1 Tax=Microbacterium sp. TaxID=51671 RepID=UPI00273769A0|nr:hypothetical protein [Microbacterium sp.]MDP3949508.1 hypothetical protein [Microbacterium sp.]
MSDDESPYGEGSWPYGLDSGAYDDELDQLLTTRGWVSDRSWKDDVAFDRWRLSFPASVGCREEQTVIACHDRHADVYNVELAGQSLLDAVTMTRAELENALEEIEAHRPSVVRCDGNR